MLKKLNLRGNPWPKQLQRWVLSYIQEIEVENPNLLLKEDNETLIEGNERGNHPQIYFMRLMETGSPSCTEKVRKRDQSYLWIQVF